MNSTRHRVLALFEKHRATPGAPYDAEHFLDFLLPAPTKDRAVYNSFRGLRRFNAFLNEFQLEFAVCLSLKEREAHYSLERFVSRVEELQQSRRSSLASLNNQMKMPVEGLVVVVNLVLLIALVTLRGSFWAAGALIVAIVAFNAWYYRFRRKATLYFKALRARIEAHERTAV